MTHLEDNSTVRLEKAKKFKKEGTEFLNASEYVKAIHNYRKIFDNLEVKEMVSHNETERNGSLFTCLSVTVLENS